MVGQPEKDTAAGSVESRMLPEMAWELNAPLASLWQLDTSGTLVAADRSATRSFDSSVRIHWCCSQEQSADRERAF